VRLSKEFKFSNVIKFNSVFIQCPECFCGMSLCHHVVATHICKDAISHCRSHDLKLMTENDSHQTTTHTKSLQSLCPLASHFIPTATPFTLGGIFCLSHIKTQHNKQTRIFSFNFTINMMVCESCELSN
jgi:hypothetical protein